MRTHLIVAALGACALSSAQFFSDNFNRADDTTLGPNYTNHGTGTFTRVIGNQAGNTSGANALSLVNSSLYSASYMHGSASVDAFCGSSLSYVALALGHNGVTTAGNGLFIKVQGTGTFTNIGFYTGINGSTTSFWTDPPIFFTATSAFASARITVWASSATTINLGIDSNFDNTFDQTYSRNLNLGSMTFGTRAGLHVFGANARADNYQVGVVPEPATMAALGLGVAALLRRRRR